MAYPPSGPIGGINQNLFPIKVNDEFYKEWVKITPLSNLMGSEMNRPIYRHKLKDGEGLQFRVGRLSALDYKNPVVGLDQRRGATQQQQVDYDFVDTKSQSFPVRLEGSNIVKLGTPIKLPGSVRPQLVEACERNFNYDLFNAMTTDIYTDTATQKPSYDRAIFSGYAPNRATYNALAGLTTALNGFGAATYNGSGMNAKLILSAKGVAERGGQAGTVEHAIRPAYMKTRSGWPMNDYILLLNPSCLQTLLDDPLFMSTTMARGTVIESDQPQAIHGADYIGKFFGTHIYLCNDLINYEVVSQDGNKRGAWNILMGAAAMTAGWHEYTNIAESTDVIERIQIFTTHEQRGQKALRFPSKVDPTQRIEQGIVHVFARIS